MKKIFLMLVIGIFVAGTVCAAPPIRIHTYTSGQTIDPDEVTANEDALFGYVQAGVDTYVAASVNAAAIGVNAVGASELISTDVTAGAYTNTNLTVDADGRITAATSGAATGIATEIEDADSDTQIQCEESADEDKIRFDVEGTETVVLGDGTNEELVKFTNAGVNTALEILLNGVLTDYGVYIYSNADQDQSNMFTIKRDNASSAANMATFLDDGAAAAVYISKVNEGNPLSISNTGTDDSIIDDSGAKLTAAGVWTGASLRKNKIDFEDITVLDKIKAIPNQAYKYKKWEHKEVPQPDGSKKIIKEWKGGKFPTKYLSPCAEDFHTTFGLGDGKSLAAKNVAGVALQGVKELLARIETLEAKVAELETRIVALE